MSEEMPDFSNVKSGSSSTATTIYEVKRGDSLSKIAKAHYGKANDWKLIFEATCLDFFSLASFASLAVKL